MHNIVDTEAGEDRDEDRFDGAESPAHHDHRADHRHDGADDGEGREDREERRPSREKDHGKGQRDPDGSARDGAGAVDLLVVHEDELLLQVCHHHPRRSARIADHVVQVLRQPHEALVLRARHFLCLVCPHVQHLRLHLDGDVPQPLAVPPEVVHDRINVLHAERGVCAVCLDGVVDAGKWHSVVGARGGEAMRVGEREKAVHHAAHHAEASVLALEQRRPLLAPRELEVVAHLRDLALALG
eukprot:823149-Rhodomonas_salina.1